ncbi:MAG: hypothetical protein WCA11_10150 [Terracidiphilus sp.]
MKWNVAILLCCSVALGQSSSKAVQHLPEALTSVLAEVKAKSHLEVLLPSELPHPFGEAKYAIVESASQIEYGISLYYKLDVGDSGFAAFFSANGHPGYGPKDIPNVREVKLSHGLVGYFREVSCGGSCAPANLWWEEDHVLYSLQLRLRPDLPDKDQQREMIAVANSAILAGPR